LIHVLGQNSMEVEEYEGGSSLPHGRQEAQREKGTRDQLIFKGTPQILPPRRPHLLKFPLFRKIASLPWVQAFNTWAYGGHFIFKQYHVLCVDGGEGHVEYIRNKARLTAHKYNKISW
jgi:hypothetical protein